MFSVVTVNVNGVRAAHKNGGLQWLLDAHAAKQADVICLQEVRANSEELAATLELAGMQDFNVLHSASSEKKGMRELPFFQSYLLRKPMLVLARNNLQSKDAGLMQLLQLSLVM